MAPRQNKQECLTRDELQRPFSGEIGKKFPPILSPTQLAELLGCSKSTIYFWIAKGRFAGACVKRGKHRRIWRDRALEIFFADSAWNSHGG